MYDIYNYYRRSAFDTLYKNLQGTTQVLGATKEEIAAVGEKYGVTSTVGGLSMNDVYNGRYIPPYIDDVADTAKRLSERRDRGYEGIPSDEILQQRIEWYMSLLGEDDIEQLPFE